MSIDTLIISGRKGALCYSKTLVADDTANPTENKVDDEVDKLEDIHIIKSGEAKRFGDLAKDLMYQAHLGQDVYPTSSTVTFEIMVRLSERYQALVQRQ